MRIITSEKPRKKSPAPIGDVVSFGAYEQDDRAENGKEDILWLVLDRQDGKTLLLSKVALDSRQYHPSYEVVTWETCDLRAWLNGTFLQNAFSVAEQGKIAVTSVSTGGNSDFSNYSIDPGSAADDRIFLLSIDEAKACFGSDPERLCAATAYAKTHGAVSEINEKCWWWLRSPGFFGTYAACVCSDGSISLNGESVHSGLPAIRPAIWIDPEG